ncbi:hypothetical protein HYFRA_00011283 [Hymenoscyphus fraxineus]|uniref:Choline transport protein n=1 Tax=Hymenoscyphus fraxineus TaxID=746836 RepID=A0A9N9KWR6_9HELO|nr:hypothetical protein HYFRA_00011283 [Hymenoscyphus fraxineus]
MSAHEMSDLQRRPAASSIFPQTHSVDKDSVIERDNAILARLGKKPVLKREFGFMSALGFTCTNMITWEGLLVVLHLSYVNGGSAGSLYAFLFVLTGNLAIFTTMAEMASMAPTSGGQYHVKNLFTCSFPEPLLLANGSRHCHSSSSQTRQRKEKVLTLLKWVAMLAPPGCQKFLSFLTGWITVIGWQANVASGGLISAQTIQELAKLLHPNYNPKHWHMVIIFDCVILLAVFLNTVVIRALPKIESIVLLLHILGFFAILIPLTYMGPHGNALDVFTKFNNAGGFPTQGLAQMIGSYSFTWTLLGSDSAIHMSEEIKNASVVVPRAMLFGILLNGIMGLAMIIAVLFCMGDPSVMASGSPYVAVFLQAVENVSQAAIMSDLVTIMIIFATVAYLATASRLTWSFARDRGLPGWRQISRVCEPTLTPVISIVCTCCISCLLALLIFYSKYALNIVLSATICCIYTSYVIGHCFLFYRRVTGAIRPYNSQSQALTNVPNTDNRTWGPFKVREPFGSIINLIGIGFAVVILFFSFWPPMWQPPLKYMNFSIFLMAASVGSACLYYFLLGGKNNYTGPIVEVN